MGQKVLNILLIKLIGMTIPAILPLDESEKAIVVLNIRLLGIVRMPGSLGCLPHLVFELHALPLLVLLGARKNIPWGMLLHPVFAITTHGE